MLKYKLAGSIVIALFVVIGVSQSQARQLSQKEISDVTTLVDNAISNSDVRISQSLSDQLDDQIVGLVRLVGLEYLQGQDVERDYERAAVLLDYAHSKSRYRREPNENLMTGYAAYVTALQYADESHETYDLGRAQCMHSIASKHGIQESSLAAGYLIRLNRESDLTMCENSEFMEALHFERAMTCTDENLSRKVLPFSQEMCELASQEYAVALGKLEEKQAREGRAGRGPGVDASMWIALALAGLAKLAIENGATDDQVERFEPPKMYEPSWLELELWVNP